MIFFSSARTTSSTPATSSDSEAEADLKLEERSLTTTSAEAIERSFEESGSVCTLRRPLNRKLLDDKVLKALKKQEERKEKAANRKKEVITTNIC